ncbi:uridine kinase [Kribbella capetownensis]|uniref:Uridine kinase n=1 Tax=Kribbella capetownensis TaxID=1572659 RepID=A0A4R0JNN8_9ACTN|nr:uridine kinase [Kribbella capetownensis]TCC46566.1 uridine kinase [Kribbella capetownensis]
MRTEALTELAETVLAVERPHPVRVAIDGCSAAGKTTLADDLAQVLADRTEREIIRAGIDYFKRAPELRTAYPIDSPESYYLDTWDHDGIRDRLLIPLGPGGDLRYATAIKRPDGQPLSDSLIQVARPDAVLLADGAFLQRPALDDHWDLRIYVHVSFDTVLRRGTARDQAWMDSAAAAEERYRSRYIPGERMYVDQVRPRSRAQVVVDNEDPANPRLTFN